MCTTAAATAPAAARQTPGRFIERHACANGECGAPIPLVNVEDVVVRSPRTGERRRRVTEQCDACGSVFVARFRMDGSLIRRVERSTARPQPFSAALRVPAIAAVNQTGPKRRRRRAR